MLVPVSVAGTRWGVFLAVGRGGAPSCGSDAVEVTMSPFTKWVLIIGIVLVILLQAYRVIAL